MAYYEYRNQKEKDEVLAYIRYKDEHVPPCFIQIKRKGAKRDVYTNKFLHGVIFKQIAKITGYTKYEVKYLMAVLHATVEEFTLEQWQEKAAWERSEYLRLYNPILYFGTIYITEKTSLMVDARFIEYCDDIKEWMNTELGVNLSDANENYKTDHELQFSV
jgi:hypothetical protein